MQTPALADAAAPAAEPPSVPARPLRTAVLQLFLLVLPVLAAVLLLRYGAGRPVTGTAAVPSGGAPAAVDPVPRLLTALPVILVGCQLAGRAARRLGQPEVIGEITAGILLGPSLLGWVWPSGYAWLFPDYLTPVIGALSQLGLVFFMVLIGHSLDRGALRGRGAQVLTVSQASIAVPFLAGVGLAVPMYRRFAPQGVSFLAFALFLAVSLSITAFPVLARILDDRGLGRTRLGALALSCAAVNDIAAWCLLVLVVSLAHGGGRTGPVVAVALAAAFAALMLLLVRPLLARTDLARRVPPGLVLPGVLCGAMLSALATDSIGIHPIFGAFLFGVALPRGSEQLGRATGQLRAVTVTLLLPLFFVGTGLHTRFALLGADGGLWAWCALVTLVAVVAKWAPSTAAARGSGSGWRESLALGALMNCRGLTELVVLAVGLQLGVITPTLFTMLVVMTLVSTALTAPALALLRWRPSERPSDR